MKNEEIALRTTSFNLYWFNHAHQTKMEFQKDSKQAIVLSVAGDILSTISQCVYSLLLQPFSSGVHKYSHKAKKGGGIGTSQIPLNNIDWKANWLKFINQWCDKDHPKTWSHQSHHASVPSLTLSYIYINFNPPWIKELWAHIGPFFQKSDQKW